MTRHRRLFVAAMIAGALLAGTLSGCIAGLTGNVSGGGGALTPSGSYPADGTMGVPLSVGLAAIVLPAGQTITSYQLTLVDITGEASLGILPDVVGEPSKALDPIERSVLYEPACQLTCAGVLEEPINIVAMRLTAQEDFNPCYAEGREVWDYCLNAAPEPVPEFLSNRTWRFTLLAGATGTDAEGKSLTLDADYSVTFETPPLFRYEYDVVDNDTGELFVADGSYTAVALLPDGTSFVAAGAKASNREAEAADTVFLHVYDRNGNLQTPQDPTLLRGSDLGYVNADMFLTSIARHGDTLLAAGRYDGPLEANRGLWFAKYSIGDAAAGYSLTLSSVETTADAETLTARPMSMALDGDGNIYVAGYQTQTGNFVRSMIVKVLNSAEGLAFDREAIFPESPLARQYNIFQFIVIDESDQIFAGGAETTDAVLSSIILHFSAELERVAWASSPIADINATDGFFDAAIQTTGSQIILYAGGYRMVNASERDAFVMALDVSSLATGSGDLGALPAYIAEATSAIGSINGFKAVALAPNPVDGTGLPIIFTGGLMELASVAESYEAGFAKTKLTLEAGSYSLPALEAVEDFVGTEGATEGDVVADLVIDNEGNVIAVGGIFSSYDETNLGGSGDDGIPTIWKLDSNLDLVTTAP